MDNEKILQKIEECEKAIFDLKNNNSKKSFWKRSFSKMNVITGIVLSLIISSTILYAANLISFTDGTVISADDVNKNFSDLDYKSPVAFGAFEFDGTKQSGSSNISCVWNAANTRYEVTISDQDFTPGTHVALVSPSNANGASTFANTSWDGGKILIIRVWTVGAGTITKGQASFHVVVYKP